MVTELCRKRGLSSATNYAWKAKFGGLEVSDAKRLRAIEEENGRLMRLLADTMLDNAGWKTCCHKIYGPPRLASVRCDRLHSLRKCIPPVCGTSRSWP